MNIANTHYVSRQMFLEEQIKAVIINRLDGKSESMFDLYGKDIPESNRSFQVLDIGDNDTWYVRNDYILSRNFKKDVFALEGGTYFLTYAMCTLNNPLLCLGVDIYSDMLKLDGINKEESNVSIYFPYHIPVAAEIDYMLNERFCFGGVRVGWHEEGKRGAENFNAIYIANVPNEEFMKELKKKLSDPTKDSCGLNIRRSDISDRLVGDSKPHDNWSRMTRFVYNRAYTGTNY